MLQDRTSSPFCRLRMHAWEVGGQCVSNRRHPHAVTMLVECEHTFSYLHAGGAIRSCGACKPYKNGSAHKCQRLGDVVIAAASNKPVRCPAGQKRCSGTGVHRAAGALGCGWLCRRRFQRVILGLSVIPSGRCHGAAQGQQPPTPH